LYDNPGYGKMQIVLRNDTLFLEYNNTNGKAFLQHYHYDIFNVRSTDATDDDQNDATKIRFITNNKGEIGSLESTAGTSSKGHCVYENAASYEIKQVAIATVCWRL
jgi:hypothetical protein